MKMYPLIKWLEQTDRSHVPYVGSKFANLGEMLKMGVPVPQGFCICTQAYQDYVEQSNLNELISGMLEKINLDDHEAIKHAAQKIREVALNQEINSSLRSEITEALNKLQDKSKATHFAIRSSSTFEDLQDSSFAGQYDSYLGVIDIEDLLAKVKKCWASLWNDRAIVYREQRNIDHLQANMAVIVQSMIACNQSGVMFTRNPLSNLKNEVIINASWGLGDAVVSEEVNGDEYKVNRTTNKINIEIIGTKEIESVLQQQGIKRIKVSANRREQQCLSEGQIRKLVSIGLKIEELFKSPQDIEWGIADHEICIFQSRGITSLKKNEEVVNSIIKELEIKNYRKDTVWSNTLLAEILTSPKPLTWEIIKLGLSKQGSFGVYERDLGLGTVASEGLLELIAGKPYYNISKLCDTFSFYGFPIKLFEYEKVKKDPSIANNFQPQIDYGKWGGNLLLFILKFLVLLPYSLYRVGLVLVKLNTLVKNCHSEFETKTLPDYLQYITAIKNMDLLEISENDLLEEINRLIQNWACVTLQDHIFSEICLGVTSGLLEAIVGEKQVIVLLSGIEGNKLLETNFKLWDLAGQASPQVANIFKGNEAGQIIEKLKSFENGREYLESVQRFLEEYGHRTSDEFELAIPRWYEDPGAVFVLIRHYLQSKKANPIEHFKTQKEIRINLEEKIAGEFSRGIYKLFPFIKALFLSTLKYSQIYSSMRETTKFYHLMEYAQLRRFLVELGSRFTKRKNTLLKDVNDIFYLLPAELSMIVKNELSHMQVEKIISNRKKEYKTNLSVQLPSVIFYDDLRAIEQLRELISSDVLEGTPVSGGRVRGRVRIILNPDELEKFREGEILVAPRTDAGWIPFFFTAAAFVMDTGNVLSHGAIVAREYGLPAVVNVKDASKILKDGQEIIVDGDEGKVYINRIDLG